MCIAYAGQTVFGGGGMVVCFVYVVHALLVTCGRHEANTCICIVFQSNTCKTFTKPVKYVQDVVQDVRIPQ